MNLKLRLVTFFSLILFANSFVYANKTNHIQTIHLGSGCFWGAEKGYESLDGVIDAVSGYANGYGVSQIIDLSFSLRTNITKIILQRW